MPLVKITTPLEIADQFNDGQYVCGNYIAMIDTAKPGTEDVTVICVVDLKEGIKVIAEYVLKPTLTPEQWREEVAKIAKHYHIEKNN